MGEFLELKSADNNNFSAYKLIEEWPIWPGKWLNIFGASGSGKTHLAKILQKKIIIRYECRYYAA